MRPTVITLALEMIEMQSLVTIASKDILEDSTESVPAQMVMYAQHDSTAHMIVQQCFDTDNVIVEQFFQRTIWQRFTVPDSVHFLGHI